MLAESEREHVEDAPPETKIINIVLPYECFDLFGIVEKDIDIMFDLGYKAAESALK
jgi:hypothetical protein